MSTEEPTEAIILTMSGMVEGVELSPKSDPALIGKFLTEIALLVRGEDKNATIHLENGIEQGSVRATVVAASGLLASLVSEMGHVQSGHYEDVSPKRVKVLTEWDKNADKNNLRYTIGTRSNSNVLTLSKEKRLLPINDVYVSGEQIIEGQVVDAGGKGNANIHLVLDDDTTLTISASREQMMERAIPMYRKMCLKVRYKLNLRTLKKSDYELVKYVSAPVWIAAKVAAAYEQGQKDWKDVKDPSAWVRSMRGKELSVD